jgi:hypothetical protein
MAIIAIVMSGCQGVQEDTANGSTMHEDGTGAADEREPPEEVFRGRGVWRVRHEIRHVTIAGGTPLARLIGRTACTVLGIPVTTTE